MKKTILILSAAFSLGMSSEIRAEEPDGLDGKQRKIVAIAASTAVGNLDALREELVAALEAGLTVNEIKEILVQMYAYCGFPRSLQGLGTFMTVMEERRLAGIVDTLGSEASTVTGEGDKYARGRETLEQLTQTSQMAVTGVNAFAPAIDVFLKEHLFADIFGRGVLTFQQRELATISALAAMEGVEPMLRSHITMGLNMGLTEEQLYEAASIIGSSVSSEREASGRRIIAEVMKNVNKSK